MVALIGFAVLDSISGLPVNGYLLAYALMTFGYIATSIGVKPRHAVVRGANLGPSRVSAGNGNAGT